MLQVFHLDIAKVDLDDTYVAMSIHACFKCFICFRHMLQIFYLDVSYVAMAMLQMFHLFLTYVAIVSSSVTKVDMDVGLSSEEERAIAGAMVALAGKLAAVLH